MKNSTSSLRSALALLTVILINTTGPLSAGAGRIASTAGTASTTAATIPAGTVIQGQPTTARASNWGC